MKKRLIAVAAILVVVVVALFVAPAFIPVDTYREQIETAARDGVIRAAYEALSVVSFFTFGEDECRAWSIPIRPGWSSRPT